jgi:hypothetical protein
MRTVLHTWHEHLVQVYIELEGAWPFTSDIDDAT